jgi:hypothetical protein
LLYRNIKKNHMEHQADHNNSFYRRVQAALPVLTTIPDPRRLDDALIESCKDYRDAVTLCLDSRIRKMQEGEIAAYLGLKRAQLAKVKMGLAKLSTEQETILQRLCSNTALRQYADKCERDIDNLIDKPGISPDVEEMVNRLVAQKVAAALTLARAA